MADNAGKTPEVQVRFVTSTSTPIDENKRNLFLPVNLARYGLSEIVNLLLGQQDKPRPYDFLIDGEFLRTDLAKYLESKKSTGESGLVLEYVEALPAPIEEPSKPHPDWVSAVDGSVDGFVLTGCYDGSVRVWYDNSNVTVIGAKHASAVKAVRFLEHILPAASSSDGKQQKGKSKSSSSAMDESEDATSSRLLVSASKDRTLRVWKFDESARRCHAVAVCKGHEESVEAVDCVELGTMFCSGSWDKRVLIWDAAEAFSDASASNSDSGSTAKKKRRVEGGEAEDADEDDSKDEKKSSFELGPIAALEGHSQCVSAVCWPDPLALYSGSWDHTIRHWDAKTRQHVSTMNGSRVVTALAFSLAANLLASGHEDSIVRLWDPRQKENDVAKLSLRSHKGWVTGVSWSRDSSYLLASSSHDGTVKLWDIRSKVPLHTMTAHPNEKSLAVDWHGSDLLVSGGSDCKLQTHRLKKPTPVVETALAIQAAVTADKQEKKRQKQQQAQTDSKADSKSSANGKAAPSASPKLAAAAVPAGEAMDESELHEPSSSSSSSSSSSFGAPAAAGSRKPPARAAKAAKKS